MERRELPLGYSIEDDDKVRGPVLKNKNEDQDSMTRTASFAFPSAAVGTAVAGPVGTFAGHIIGATVAWRRTGKMRDD